MDNNNYNNELFHDYGVTRQELNRTLEAIINALDEGAEIEGVTGDDVYTALYVLNNALNKLYGIPEE